METELLFEADQQDDLRGLLETLQAYFKGASGLFAASGVLVGPAVASIVVPLGARPAPEDLKAQDARSQAVRGIRLVFTDFYRELGSTGSALIQFVETEEEQIVARYRLIPNDVIGAERGLAKLIKRLNGREVKT